MNIVTEKADLDAMRRAISMLGEIHKGNAFSEPVMWSCIDEAQRALSRFSDGRHGHPLRLRGALRAIIARFQGRFDDPDLMGYGPFTTDSPGDVIAIAKEALK